MPTGRARLIQVALVFVVVAVKAKQFPIVTVGRVVVVIVVLVMHGQQVKRRPVEFPRAAAADPRKQSQRLAPVALLTLLPGTSRVRDDPIEALGARAVFLYGHGRILFPLPEWRKAEHARLMAPRTAATAMAVFAKTRPRWGRIGRLRAEAPAHFVPGLLPSEFASTKIVGASQGIGMAAGIPRGVATDEDEKPALTESEASPDVEARVAAPLAGYRILDRAPNALMALDRRWRYAYINEAGARLVGRTPSDLTGRVIWDVWPEAVGGAFWDAYHRAMNEGELVEAEEYFPALDVWLEARAYPIDVGIAVHLTDVTVHRQEDHARARLAAVAETSNDAIVIRDVDGTIVFWNEGATGLFGYTAEEMLGTNGAVLIPPEVTHERSRLMQKVLQGRTVADHDAPRIRKDGSRIFVSSSRSPIRDRGGKVISTAGIARDITERKQAEEALRASEAKLRGLYRMPHVGLVLTDINCRYLEFNEAFRRITGYSDDELRGLDSWQLTPKQYEAVDLQQQELAKRTGRFGPYEKEYIRKDGSLIPLQLNGALFTASGGTQYLWTIVEDITDRKRLERAVLEATDRERRNLGADMHDGLGQELTGIALMLGALAQSAKKAAAPEAEQLEQLELQMRRAIANCRTIAHGLSPLNYASGGLIEALKNMASRQEGSAYGPEVHFAAVMGAPLRLAPDAMDHLYRIAQEAVANAQRHAEARRIDIRIDIQSAAVRLEVQDDGVGFAPRTTEATGMGQQIMRFRTSIIGACLAIGAGRGGGTLVAVDCPQPPET
jgi:two-component system, LuxR family, sensor kinase FixL